MRKEDWKGVYNHKFISAQNHPYASSHFATSVPFPPPPAVLIALTFCNSLPAVFFELQTPPHREKSNNRRIPRATEVVRSLYFSSFSMLPKKSPSLKVVVALAVLLLVLSHASTVSASSQYSLFSGVYVKLLPGKEFCLNYNAYRDPQEDAVTVAFQHRCIDPRLAAIRTRLYAPSSEPGQRGAQLPLDETLDTFGETTQIFFKAEQTGTYKMCFMLPLMKPAMRFEMSFSAVNDVVEPPTLEDDAFVVDKPPEMADYEERLRMINISIETTVDELRMYQTRRSFFDHTTRSAFNLCLMSVLLNIVIAVGVSLWSNRYLERYFVKQKIA